MTPVLTGFSKVSPNQSRGSGIQFIIFSSGTVEWPLFFSGEKALSKQVNAASRFPTS